MHCIYQTLLETNQLPDRNLRLRVKRINSDERRVQALHDNEQRLFRKQGLLYNFEPTIVVERPASPESASQNELPDRMPHYMTGMISNVILYDWYNQ